MNQFESQRTKFMKTQLNLQKSKTRSPKPAPPIYFRLGAMLGCLCIGAGLLMPAVKSRIESHHPLPAGQFQADMRTVFAAVRYLLTPEIIVPPNPVPSDNSSTTLAQITPAQTLEMAGIATNQTGAPVLSSTNSPAQT